MEKAKVPQLPAEPTFPVFKEKALYLLGVGETVENGFGNMYSSHTPPRLQLFIFQLCTLFSSWFYF